MKKGIASLMAAFLLLAGCGKMPTLSFVPVSQELPSAVSVESSAVSAESSAVGTVSYVTKPDDMSAAAFLKQNFPVTDGSTSTIPLDAAVRSAIFNTGLDYETDNVKHTTTFGSFDRLLAGEVDLTYTVPLSAEQKQAAKDKNIELEPVPIAREAFVFVLNAKNPVTKLSQEQLRDIYSGKITNWKQVGGNDAPIVAYQRNKTSGSQTYMTAFMGDTPLTEPPKTLVAESMGGLMDAIALYDNAENAIGYSVYAYAADMYGTGRELKFAAVDGIAPNDTTMKDGTYPLLSENYAIFRASEPKGSPARVLAEWLVTEDGQQAVANGGYIPFGVDPSTVVAHKNAWKKVGTGPKATGKETLPTSYYKANVGEGSYDPYQDIITDRAYTIMVLDESELHITDGYKSDSIVWNIRADFTGLVSKEKNAAVTDIMNQSIKELTAQRTAFEAYLKELNKSQKSTWQSVGTPYNIQTQGHTTQQYSWESAIQFETVCFNGYLSISARLHYNGPYESGNFDCRTTIFDLYTGKQVAFTDLFYEGTDIAAMLNSAVKHYVNGDLYGDAGYAHIRHENPVVTEEVTNFTLNKIYYPHVNHCFNAGVSIEYDIFALPSHVSALRSMDGLWRSVVQVYHTALTESVGWGLRKNGVLMDKEKNFYAVEADAYVSQATADKINAVMKDYIDTVHKKSLTDYYKETGWTRNELVLYFRPDIEDGLKSSLDDYLNERGATIDGLLEWGLEYVRCAPMVICGKCVVYPRAGAYFEGGSVLEEDSDYAFYLPISLVFDIDTGEPIQLSKLFLNGWEKTAKWYDLSESFFVSTYNAATIAAPKIDDLVLVDLSWGTGYYTQSTATFMTKDGKKTYQAEIPGAYLNFD